MDIYILYKRYPLVSIDSNAFYYTFACYHLPRLIGNQESDFNVQQPELNDQARRKWNYFSVQTELRNCRIFVNKATCTVYNPEAVCISDHVTSSSFSVRTLSHTPVHLDKQLYREKMLENGCSCLFLFISLAKFAFIMGHLQKVKLPPSFPEEPCIITHFCIFIVFYFMLYQVLLSKKTVHP